jgi:peptidyl-prolyl cis-trans isomerase D
MLAQIRAFSNTIFAKGILVLLLLALVGFGVQGVSRMGNVKDTVVEAGGRSVSSAKFRQFFDTYHKQIDQQQGQPVPSDALFKANVDGRLAEEVAVEESVAELLNREGIRPSDRLIAERVRDQGKRFLDPVTGRFDEKAYKAFLAQNGLTPEDFEGGIRDQLAQSHFGAGLGAGMSTPLIYSALTAAYGQESRNVRFFVVTPQTLGPPLQPTDAQLTAFMKEHAAQLIKPETRVVTLARFSASQLAPTLTPDAADLQKRFAFEKESLSKPELRTVEQLVLSNGTQAAEAARRIKAGEAPAAVAKALAVAAPLELTNTPKTRISDPKVADAAFALKAGESSGPIQGALAWAVVKVINMTPGHEVSFDEVKDKLIAEARKALSAEKALEMSKKFDDLHSGGTHLVDAANKVGAQVVQLPPITKDGHTGGGQQLQLPAKFLQQAFTMAKGAETEGVEEVAPGEYYAIRIEAINPQAPFTLDEIRVPLTRQVVQEDMLKRLQARGTDLIARAGKGERLDALAAASGAKVSEIKGLARADQNAAQALGQQFVGTVFASKTGATVQALLPNGLAIIRIDATGAGDVASVAQQAVAQRRNAASAVNRQIAEATRTAARKVVKPHIDLKRARGAAGGDPDTVVTDASGTAAKATKPGA